MRDVFFTVGPILIVVIALSATDISDWFAERRKQHDAKRANEKEKLG